MTEVAASFKAPFAEQLAALRLRFADLRPTAKWDDLWQAEHERAFMVAGATKADLLADLAEAVDRAVSQGTTFETFKGEFRNIVEKHGWHGWTGEGTAKGEEWRMRVIYRTNIATSWAAGRMAQLVDGKFKYWVYKHGGSREPRLQHLAWDGIALQPDHPFWATHAPPNGWGCSCLIYGARSAAGIKRVGGDPEKELPDGWQVRDPKTGAPVGIDKGWDYAVGRSVADTVALGGKKIASLPPEIGADFGRGIEGLIDRAWPLWVADTLVKGSHTPGVVGVLQRDVIEALAERNVAPASAEMMVQPGILIGPKAARHELAGDALTPMQWLILPRLIRRPAAVLLDEGSGNLIYLLGESDGKTPQLAVALDYRLRRNRKTLTTNTVVSAYVPSPGSILGRIAGGLLTLILGSVG